MIEINNLTTVEIDEKILKDIVDKVLKEELGMSTFRNIELSIALIRSGRMRKLNKKYRSKNRVTDVLAFPESKILFEKYQIKALQKTKGLGEIVICLREVLKNSRKLEASFNKELSRILIHGLLHLLGYEHEKGEKSAKIMEEKQEQYLLKF